MISEIEKLESLFRISKEAMSAIIAAFHDEMDRGLTGKQSSLKMLPAYVDNPSGKEKGNYLALDLGGSNYRVLMVGLNGDGSPPQVVSSKYALTEAQITTTGEVLFAALADSLREFLNTHHYHDKYNLGFTFSFPIDQTNIDEGKLLTWTKEFDASDVEGQDVVNLLRETLHRKNIDNVEVVSLDNDTVGTQVARAYADANCDIGGIIGTGTNYCYLEDVANIRKPLNAYHHQKMIINIESGNFNKNLPLTEYDRLLDANSNNQGKQLEEKMVAGKYLGEIARLIFLDLVKKRALFNGFVPAFLMTEDGFQTPDMSLIEADRSTNLWGVRTRMKQLGMLDFTFNEAKIIKGVCHIVAMRAARLAATILAAIVTKIDPGLVKPHVAAIDGSVFYRYPGFRQTMVNTLAEVFGDEKASLIRLEPTEDGSGIGAAIIAAVAVSGK